MGVSRGRTLSWCKASIKKIFTQKVGLEGVTRSPRSRRRIARSLAPSHSACPHYLSEVRSPSRETQPMSETLPPPEPDEMHTCMHIFVLPAAGKQCSSALREVQLADEHHQLAARHRLFCLQWLAMDGLSGCCSSELQKAAMGSDSWHACGARCMLCSVWQLRGRDSCSGMQLSRTRDCHESNGCSGQ